jgi:hypothetical protein
MNGFPDITTRGDFDTQVEVVTDEMPLSEEWWDEGIPVTVTHASGRLMGMTVYGEEEKPALVRLSSASGNGAHLDDDLLAAVAIAIGGCCMEVVDWPDWFYSSEE